MTIARHGGTFAHAVVTASKNSWLDGVSAHEGSSSTTQNHPRRPHALGASELSTSTMKSTVGNFTSFRSTRTTPWSSEVRRTNPATAWETRAAWSRSPATQYPRSAAGIRPDSAAEITNPAQSEVLL